MWHHLIGLLIVLNYGVHSIECGPLIPDFCFENGNCEFQVNRTLSNQSVCDAVCGPVPGIITYPNCNYPLGNGLFVCPKGNYTQEVKWPADVESVQVQVAFKLCSGETSTDHCPDSVLTTEIIWLRTPTINEDDLEAYNSSHRFIVRGSRLTGFYGPRLIVSYTVWITQTSPLDCYLRVYCTILSANRLSCANTGLEQEECLFDDDKKVVPMSLFTHGLPQDLFKRNFTIYKEPEFHRIFQSGLLSHQVYVNSSAPILTIPQVVCDLVDATSKVKIANVAYKVQYDRQTIYFDQRFTPGTTLQSCYVILDQSRYIIHQFDLGSTELSRIERFFKSAFWILYLIAGVSLVTMIAVITKYTMKTRTTTIQSLVGRSKDGLRRISNEIPVQPSGAIKSKSQTKTPDPPTVTPKPPSKGPN